jgi:uncharacterized membrane protein YesL
MKNIFGIDSKAMQVLSKIWDLFMLNLLYLVCCIPVVTIGAAQAGLYTGFRVVLNPEDDSSCIAAFFRGFKNGFSVITPVWLILTIAVCFAAHSCLMSYVIEKSGGFAITIIAIAGLIAVIILQTMIPLFHSRFSCSRRQLLKNTLYFMFAHPLHSFLIAVLIWMPIILFLLDAVLFARLTILILTAWYGVAALFTLKLIKKPFQVLEEHFQKTYDEDGNPISPAQEAEETSEV